MRRGDPSPACPALSWLLTVASQLVFLPGIHVQPHTPGRKGASDTFDCILSFLFFLNLCSRSAPNPPDYCIISCSFSQHIYGDLTRSLFSHLCCTPTPASLPSFSDAHGHTSLFTFGFSSWVNHLGNTPQSPLPCDSLLWHPPWDYSSHSPVAVKLLQGPKHSPCDPSYKCPGCSNFVLPWLRNITDSTGPKQQFLKCLLSYLS